MPKTKSKSFLDILRRRELVGDASFQEHLPLKFVHTILRRHEVTEFCVANNMVEMCDDDTTDIDLICVDPLPSDVEYQSESSIDTWGTESPDIYRPLDVTEPETDSE